MRPGDSRSGFLPPTSTPIGVWYCSAPAWRASASAICGADGVWPSSSVRSLGASGVWEIFVPGLSTWIPRYFLG